MFISISNEGSSLIVSSESCCYFCFNLIDVGSYSSAISLFGIKGLNTSELYRVKKSVLVSVRQLKNQII